MIREALAIYVAEQRSRAVEDNPLLAIAGLGSSAEPMDLADGRDEALLRQGVELARDWEATDGGDS